MRTPKRPTVADGAHEGERGGLTDQNGVSVLHCEDGGSATTSGYEHASAGDCSEERALWAKALDGPDRARIAEVAERFADGEFASEFRGHLVSSSALAATVESQFVTLRFWRAASASIAAQRLGVKRIDFAMGLGEVGNELTILVADFDEELTGVVGNHGVGPIIIGVRGNRGLGSGSRGVEANGGTGQNHLGNSYNLIPVRYHGDTSNATKVKTSLKESLEAA